MLAFVWAEDQQGLIGAQGHLPWHLPADLQRFKQVTWQQTIVMGRKTYASFPQGPLPQRHHLVLTRRVATDFPPTVEVFATEASLRQRMLTEPQRCFYVIGGVALFKMFAKDVDRLYQTRIEATYSGDTYMPPLAWSKFELIKQADFSAQGGHPAYHFLDYRRRD
ncbi:dihydrofolate reductase [Lapidilactobacillus luobeiensis]|uniref:dihydrofolate reductase n=1 Tax=Lapidilactobacillus luobeiensis TaxID=2950371 RepID=UPI0021C4B029|nr:dihydrofolate reductase [Lapidilactobacillus luobeiensis]